MSMVVGSAIMILDLGLYLLIRADQEIARVNEELASLRSRFADMGAAHPDVASRLPREWLAMFCLDRFSADQANDLQRN